jgi:hypothetical protein
MFSLDSIVEITKFTFFFAEWKLNLSKHMRENQQMHQLFIAFINYVW